MLRPTFTPEKSSVHVPWGLWGLPQAWRREKLGSREGGSPNCSFPPQQTFLVFRLLQLVVRRSINWDLQLPKLLFLQKQVKGSSCLSSHQAMCHLSVCPSSLLPLSTFCPPISWLLGAHLDHRHAVLLLWGEGPQAESWMDSASNGEASCQ